MSTLTITIEAPEMVAAIRDLAAALQGGRPNQQAIPAPVQPAPAPAPVAAVPQAIPTATVTPQPAPAPQQVAAVGVPTTAATYTIDQLAYAASPLIDAGKLPELQALLRQFGISLLTELPAEQYGAFATALRGLGAKI